MNNLNQFPLKIAEAETKILNLDRQVTIYKEQLSFMDGEIETAIRRSLALRDRVQQRSEEWAAEKSVTRLVQK